MNSLALTLDGEILDFYEGLRDIERRILRATSSQFVEDPLRVLRGMQFAARFGMTLDSGTAEMCRGMACEFHSLARERIWAEFHKLMAKGQDVSRGLLVLSETNWLSLFPELHAMAGCPQDPEWHPEGDVWQHTLHVCDAALDIAKREGLSESERLVLLFAALLHDVGKPATTARNDSGRWTAPAHDEAGVKPARSFLESMGAPGWLVSAVLPLVREHMAHLSVPGPNDRIVRRLALRLSPASVEAWGHLVEADHSGRPPLPKDNPVESFVQRARQLAVEDAQPEPILLGRHLISELGMTPSPAFKPILDEAFEIQLDEGWERVDEALAWAREHHG